jgi:hypothetical protein
VRDAEALASLGTAALEDITPGAGAHPLTKAVLVATLAVAGLKSAFHGSRSPVVCALSRGEYPVVPWAVKLGLILSPNVFSSSLLCDFQK